MHVHLNFRPEDPVLETLKRELDPGIQLSCGDSPPPDWEVEVLVAGRPDQELLEACRGLRAVIIPWAGVPTRTKQLLRDDPGLSVHNLHHNAAATAELALSLLLAASKQVIPFDRSLRNHNWQPRYQEDQTILLAGKEALVLGYGAIGRRVAGYLNALGMKVLVIRRFPEKGGDNGVSVYGPDRLRELLPRAAALVLALPLTEETRGWIGAEELELLSERSVLVNVSRGPIVDQKALFQALESGKIFGAGLDVWYNYPAGPEEREGTPPADYPFGELDRVVLSPHRGGKSPDVEYLRMQALAASLNAAARGEHLPNRVDLNLGY
jgi:phosphoglycerate dehydrogenase-like enzyme